MDTLNEAQERALIVLPAISGSLSILGSAFIAYMVLVKRPATRTTYHRLLLGMSLLEIMFASQALFAFKVLPEIHPYAEFNHGHGSHGDNGSHDAQSSHHHHDSEMHSASSDDHSFHDHATIDRSNTEMHSTNHETSTHGRASATGDDGTTENILTIAARNSNGITPLDQTPTLESVMFRNQAPTGNNVDDSEAKPIPHSTTNVFDHAEAKQHNGTEVVEDTTNHDHSEGSSSSDDHDHKDAENHNHTTHGEVEEADVLACDVVGFLTHLAIGVAGYNAAISIYYFLTICRGMKADVMARLVEPFLHGTILTYIFGTAIASVILELFNVDECGLMCYIAPYPQDCVGNEDIECIRGAKAESYVWWFSFVEILLFFGIILICQTAIFCFVRKNIRRVRRYSFDRSAPQQHRPSSLTQRIRCCLNNSRSQGTMSHHDRKVREVAIQSGLFLTVFVVTWGPFALTRLAHIFHAPLVHDNFVLFAFVIETLFPLQGFLNFLVYLRPVYNKYRTSNKEASWDRCLWASLSGYDMAKWRREGGMAALSSSRYTSEMGTRFSATHRHLQSIVNALSRDLLSVSRSEDSSNDFEDVRGRTKGSTCFSDDVPTRDMDETSDYFERRSSSSSLPQLDGSDHRRLPREHSNEYAQYKMKLSSLSSLEGLDMDDSSDVSYQC